MPYTASPFSCNHFPTVVNGLTASAGTLPSGAGPMFSSRFPPPWHAVLSIFRMSRGEWLSSAAEGIYPHDVSLNVMQASHPLAAGVTLPSGVEKSSSSSDRLLMMTCGCRPRTIWFIATDSHPS